MTSPKSIAEGDELNIGQYKFEVIGTPGHSQGGVCFYCQQENVLFSGDTLFQGSIGRTDLEGGSYPTLIRSLQEKVFTLPPQTRVLAGHGGETTIDYEIKYNPYV
jgi:glyoxylase-like metal-dependent hydrolase (beta-lactamase superfamily II)